MVSDEVLTLLEDLSQRCDAAPWTALIEGRDFESGDSFIRTGEGATRGEDIYVPRDSGPAGAAYLDLIATLRTHLPELIAEVRAARRE
jgi:hypothetical protein